MSSEATPLDLALRRVDELPSELRKRVEALEKRVGELEARVLSEGEEQQ